MVRAILLRGSVVSTGIVNYGGEGDIIALKKAAPWLGKILRNENVKVGKHDIRKIFDKDGLPVLDDQGRQVYEIRLKISSNCLRQAIFKEDHPFQNNSLLQHAPDALLTSIASPAGVLRGYMFADKGIKRASPLIITSAIDTTGALPTLEAGSQSGPKAQKDPKVAEDSDSDLSLHAKECAAKLILEFEGMIDLKQLQFISCSARFDRLAVLPENIAKFREKLGQKLSEIPEEAYYVDKNAVNGLPEKGILFTQAQISRLVDELFQRLLSLTITRAASGIARMGELKIKLVQDPLVDLMDDLKNGWHVIKAPSDWKQIEGSVVDPSDICLFYDKKNQEEAEKFFKDLDKVSSEFTEKKIARNKEEREKKEKAKAEAKERKNESSSNKV